MLTILLHICKNKTTITKTTTTTTTTTTTKYMG
jgi:hypothetical protein